MTNQSAGSILAEVHVAEIVAPASLSLHNGCILRRQGRKADGRRIDGLLESPSAILGTLVHKAIELADGRSNLADVFLNLVTLKDEELLGDPRRRHLVPLRLATSEVSWATSLRLLAQRTGAGIPHKWSGPSLPRSVLAVPSASHEFSLESRRLGLRGTVDLLEHLADGSIRVIDWKTGSIVDEEGQIKAEYRLQLAAYALLCNERWPAHRVELFLNNGDLVPVGVTAQDARRVRDNVKYLLGNGARGAPRSARALALAGDDCRSCPIRNRCPVYRESLEGTGRGIPSTKWGHAGDLMGRVEGAVARPAGGIANLRLPTGQLVQLRGLTERFDLRELVGNNVLCFGFKPNWRRNPVTGEPEAPNTYLETWAKGRAWQAEIYLSEG